eukprot:1667638-Pyramimonas_sp.AAC.2
MTEARNFGGRTLVTNCDRFVSIGYVGRCVGYSMTSSELDARHDRGEKTCGKHLRRSASG